MATQMSKPRFKYELFLNHHKSYKNTQQKVFCFADIYEISLDGTITFFHTMKSEDKKIKIPVLSYPKGKWEGVVLVDDSTQSYPVFNISSSSSIQMQFESDESESHTDNEKQQERSDNYFSNKRTGYQSTTQHSINNGMLPGVQQNLQDYKQDKKEWLEKHIKDYVKSQDHFKTEDFLKSILRDSEFRIFKPDDSDVEWAASTVIREKNVPTRKFSDPLTQKELQLCLPDIMKRQWSGKMSPILEVLQQREETKNVNSIDLSVWMVNNNID